MTAIWKLNFFIVSNLPIYFIVLITKFSFQKNFLDYFLSENLVVYLSVFGILYSLIVLLKLSKRMGMKENGTRKKIEIDNLNENYLITLTAYLLPLLSLLTPGIRGEFAFVFTLLVTLLLFMKTDNYYSSFGFFLLGYNIYEAISENEKFILISKKSMNELNGHDIKIRYFDNSEETKKDTVTKVVIEKGIEYVR
ncbi:hypothetical protein [Lactococcus lactis]|uniref:hypothetical protein n=1 Tax=Lactococcus lactis TaxID=1358 RepID=UPI002417354E|nr:hypothetical protein [Lactococcus lactis]MDG4958838.1 hypothetical protein [Lactococcus lactis]